MKLKNYAFLLVLLFGFQLAHAQNLVVNGGLESWTAGEPDGWDLFENIAQETTIYHGGSSSARHTSGENSNYKLQQSVAGIQAGQEYTISYWYYDNDPMARTRIWSTWLAAGAPLAGNEEVLHPTVYSEDNANWMEFSVTLVAPATADGFRFEVRVYKQDGNLGGSVFYDDFVVSGDVTVDPEPSNYPTAFSASASGTGIELNWTDATGDQLPLAYVILAGTNASLPVPVDGTPIADDTDLSDGNGALNVAYGNESAAFANLTANTPYYFTIYPYSNAAANIDFKTDGTAPAANATTTSVLVIEYEDFEEGFGNWTSFSVIGAEVWGLDPIHGVNGSQCAKMSGYAGAPFENEDWLISPALNLSDYENPALNFQSAVGYDGPVLECMVSNDYSGSGDPNAATWSNLSFNYSTEFFVYTESGNIDLSAFIGPAVYVAYKFTSTTVESATWEVDEISITGEGPVGINKPSSSKESISIYPNPTSGMIYVNTDNSNYSNVEVRSLTGKLVRSFELNGSTGTYDLSELQSGMYFVVFSNSDNNKLETHKLIIR